ncbi:MerR-like DNA binding protein [Balneicella halophila]|uniref:MerR-like DNA binding protein n=1 Tax=Balneicella halophila TaxID=1537566 RepID=A0A7L4UQS8_BALHA|nr:MerR family transcriptional regulator [Balneicella halophila]PVX50952.1 MerR-like DNA binding protein [Balneicella halophila]
MTTFNKLYYSISEVANHFDEEVSAIRYWEKRFSILKPKKNKRGVRLFTAKDMENIEIIHYLIRVKKLTVEGAIKELELHGEKTEHKIEVLRKLKDIHSLLEKIKNKL